MITFEASCIFEAAGAAAKIGLSLKPNQHKQVKLVQIPNTHCSIVFTMRFFLVVKQQNINGLNQPKQAQFVITANNLRQFVNKSSQDESQERWPF